MVQLSTAARKLEPTLFPASCASHTRPTGCRSVMHAGYRRSCSERKRERQRSLTHLSFPFFRLLTLLLVSVPLIFNINDCKNVGDLFEDLRGYKKAIIPRFSTYFVKNSIRYRGAVLWNLVSDYFKDSYSFKKFYRKVQSDPKFREFRFICS